MRVPNENLDDFMGFAVTRERLRPPAKKRAMLSGFVVVLKPLCGPEDLSQCEASERGSSTPFVPLSGAYQLSWFHGSLAVGAGSALVALLLLLGSSLYIGIYGPDNERASGGSNNTAADEDSYPFLEPPVESENVDFSTVPSFPRVPVRVRGPRITPNRRSAKVRPAVRTYRRPRRPRRPKFVMTDFVPTRLLIYPEDGMIKRRVEPQLISRHRKARRFPTS